MINSNWATSRTRLLQRRFRAPKKNLTLRKTKKQNKKKWKKKKKKFYVQVYIFLFLFLFLLLLGRQEKRLTGCFFALPNNDLIERKEEKEREAWEKRVNFLCLVPLESHLSLSLYKTRFFKNRYTLSSKWA